MHYLLSVYFVSQPLHVSGMFVAHHQDVYCACMCVHTHTHTQGIHRRMVRFLKLTINLCLTLHGHNLHRQQQQMFQFLMRYQQFACHAYCGAAGPVSKMASQQEEAFCVCV